MASSFVAFHTFPQDFLTGKHNFDEDTFHVMLTNSKPDEAVDLDYTNIIECPEGNGYTTGGKEISVALSQEDAVAIVFGSPVVWTGSGAGFGPVQYAVMFNYTQADQRLVCYWEYPSPITVLATEKLSLVPSPTGGIFKVV